MKFSVSDKKLRYIFDKIVNSDRHLKNWDTVTELISDLQESRDLADLRVLQIKLLEAVSSAEDEQRVAKKKEEAARLAIGSIRKETNSRKVGSDKEKHRELKSELDKRCLEIEVLKRVRRQLRGVGDGLLWKAVGFSRHYTYAVSDAPGLGNTFLSDPKGLNAELKAAEYFWKTEGALAVIHDLTNCGKIGDLTIVAPGKTFRVAEVKASGSLDPKQMERMKGMCRFLRGAPKPREGGQTTRFVKPDKVSLGESVDWEWNNWEHYVRALSDAGSKGLGCATVKDYLAVAAVSILHPRWQELNLATDTEEEFLYEAWGPARRMIAEKLVTDDEDIIAFWDSSEKYEEDLPGAPFSVYPLPPRFCAALTCDYLTMATFMNVTNFYKRFGSLGFDVLAVPLPAGKKRSDQVFFHAYLSRPQSVTGGSAKPPIVQLGKPLMLQVLGEAMSAETVAQAVEMQMADMVGGDEASLLCIDSDGGMIVDFLSPTETPPPRDSEPEIKILNF